MLVTLGKIIIIYIYISISEDHRKEYSQVLSEFDGFFGIRKNVIIEHTKFKCRCQLSEELAEQFIASLHNLTADCKYGDK